MNWITCGNALRLDWLSICPPTGTGVKHHADDLFHTPLDQAQIDFENEGGETYICGNPPYLGSKWQKNDHKEDLKAIFDSRTPAWKSLDYVAGWFMKAADYGLRSKASAAFVSTNSICQGQQVPILWPLIFETGHQISFAHTSFKWANLASHNAGVIVAIVAISRDLSPPKRLFSIADDGSVIERQVSNINAYLVAGANKAINVARSPIANLSPMLFGNMPRDGGHFILSADERAKLLTSCPELARFIRPYLGSEQMIQGKPRWCIWIEAKDLNSRMRTHICAPCWAACASSVPVVQPHLLGILLPSPTASSRLQAQPITTHWPWRRSPPKEGHTCRYTSLIERRS